MKFRKPRLENTCTCNPCLKSKFVSLFAIALTNTQLRFSIGAAQSSHRGFFLHKQMLDLIISSLEPSPAFHWQSSKSRLKAFLWVQGNNFARVESRRYFIIALGHISNDRGEVGEMVLREIERDLHQYSCLSIKNLEGSFSIIPCGRLRRFLT